MSRRQNPTFKSWATHVNECSRKLNLLAKSLLNTSGDPFSQRQRLEKATKVLEKLKLDQLTPPAAIWKQLDGKCIQLAEEFWNSFTKETGKLGWEVHGTTNRRLINRGIFLNLKGGRVIIEEVNVALDPYVLAVIEHLKPEIESLLSKKLKLEVFMDVLASAYDELEGPKEKSIEAVYRQAILLSQTPAFWKGGSQKRFNSLTRAMFRARLSEVLRTGLRDKSGRELQFGTTADTREKWEIFSPGEGQVVQVGRMALV